MKKLQHALLATLVTTSLAVSIAPTAHAVTPDSLYPLSAVWSNPRVMKEYFDWRAYVGWGVIGTTNLLITIGTGASQGQITKAGFTALCGSVAAGLLSVWKPVSEPTMASHFKAIMKSGGVVAAASACGWVSQFAFNAIDREIPKAQEAINRKVTPSKRTEIHDDAAHINNDLLTMESAYAQVAKAMSEAMTWKKIVNETCNSSESAQSCTSARANLNAATSRAENVLRTFNSAGGNLHHDLVEINNDIPS